eukprot:CAMPEP_0183510852 /NCGR_PEP_ID=MMETSP0371-20130417/10550_1 /TAXON_ID=268820 /ORGANISM="Peridinium aciculiferum, Strain PAER-2" /LENGTH=320 /DNA_ID=CAMNT_0025707715 /DNA_START=69 /DNA_END=1031 /DNA_ORIENTATION=+
MALAMSRRRTGSRLVALGAVAVATACSGLAASRSFVALGASSAARQTSVARRALDITDQAEMEEYMKDPANMKKIEAEFQNIMADPAKKQAMESWQIQVKSGVEKLKQDPEMKEYFDDVEKNGMEAIKRWEKDEKILRKFSEATGGPEAMGAAMGGMPGMGGMPSMGGGGAMSSSPRSWAPGDMAIIRGLKAKPELNGKKAMVVPPTADERETLKGTGRLIVRLIDTGEQFAVKPDNLKTTAEEADDIMGSNLEDVSMYNPAIQTEAAKLRESGKLDDLENHPELKPIFEDIKKNGMSALEKYWNDDELMAKISKVMGKR